MIFLSGLGLFIFANLVQLFYPVRVWKAWETRDWFTVLPGCAGVLTMGFSIGTYLFHTVPRWLP